MSTPDGDIQDDSVDARVARLEHLELELTEARLTAEHADQNAICYIIDTALVIVAKELGRDSSGI
jgi:hypothetical protein